MCRLLLLLFLLSCLGDPTKAVRIVRSTFKRVLQLFSLQKVGHIGAVNVMPKAEAVLEVCRRELWREGVLNDKFDIE